MHPTDEAQSDTLLLDRLAAQDSEALGELYDRHGRLLFGLLVRMLRNHDDAEEVLQEVFVQVWTRAHTFNGGLGSPVAWLIGITRNRAIDRLRARGSMRRTPEAVPTPLPVATPEFRASNAERRAVVQEALAALPGAQRELIERAYFLGATQSELAAELNLPLGTVKTRMRTGLLGLRAALERRFS
jgi:RNA polymerase sigma-70 factor (ECF subfamily)